MLFLLSSSIFSIKFYHLGGLKKTLPNDKIVYTEVGEQTSMLKRQAGYLPLRPTDNNLIACVFFYM